MGIVDKAHDTKLNSTVALKFPPDYVSVRSDVVGIEDREK